VTALDTDGPVPLSYSWSVPAGTGSLSNGTTATPVFTPAAGDIGADRDRDGDGERRGGPPTTGTVDVAGVSDLGRRRAAGLVGWWRLDESGSATTARGTAAANGNTGTLTSGGTWTAGRIGGARCS
jgi:hypothetical protein